jgi:hypothetical protein
MGTKITTTAGGGERAEAVAGRDERSVRKSLTGTGGNAIVGPAGGENEAVGEWRGGRPSRAKCKPTSSLVPPRNNLVMGATEVLQGHRWPVRTRRQPRRTIVWHRERHKVRFEILNGGSPARAHIWERREGRTSTPTGAVIEVRGRQGARWSTLPFRFASCVARAQNNFYVSVKKNCGVLTDF